MRVIKSLFDLMEENICEIVCPNSYFEKENDGFLIKQLSDSNYCQIVEKITDKEKKLMNDYEFPFVEWNDFENFFTIIKD